ncbi:DnaD domain protein [Clostridium frigidicarnis]|uniref:DnaD and phage-associated domain-containing protein n=1 Tax=Clostridium frigidicarnis TaxID=84698 RepID=A0A1I1B9N9_9CLOT|nr:DnaD domain protein [Clostridium frigidicarnis]SFB47105.1 DnaD and phage-associated domain-containing protein [Clostridium frigidicarnis]
MSTFMFKSNSMNYTPVSNIFIEKFMPKARGEFVKVYLLMLKYNSSGEIGVNSTITASTLNLLESDIMNALNYWNDEGVINLVPVDKFGNFSVEFVDLDNIDLDSIPDVSLLDELNKDSIRGTMKEIERILGRPLNPNEMENYLSWQNQFNFSPELILLLIEYCVSKGKSDCRYFEKVAISWYDSGVRTIEDAQTHIKQHEDKWIKYRKILSYLGLKDSEIMKPQQDILNKWVKEWGFPVEVIEKAAKICFERLNRADFKYMDGILSSWNKEGIKTLNDVLTKNNKSKFTKTTPKNQKGNFNNFEQRTYDFDSLERKLLGWDKND